MRFVSTGMLVLILACAGLVAQIGSLAQTRPAAKVSNGAADWPMYNRDLDGTRFSPLTEINPNNVSTLTQAWTFAFTAPQPAAPRGEAPAGRGGGGRGGAGNNPEATPIVVNGVMYLPAGNRVLALEAETGKEIWTYHLPAGNTTARGVAYWPGDRNMSARIMFTAGPRLVAINAFTGEPSAGFGVNGMVDIQVGWNGVPLIFKNVVMLGATVGEMPTGESGNTRGFDARSGDKLWEFNTVPRPGELGNDTWLDGSWKDRSGTNVWGWYLTMDEKRGMLYMPIGSPAPNYYGGERKGNNLFGNSIVAIDAQTGKYKWHFQTVHHDLWDSDLPPAPVLIDIKQNGRTIPALAAIGKQSWMFILNRETGKPIFGVEERAVPAGDVPGEWYSPTQPFPLKPPALARTSFKKEEMVTADDTTADHAKACQDLWERAGGFYNAGPFTPFLFHEEGAPPKSTIIFPGNGGPNWGGMAADPRMGYVFVQTHDQALSGWMEKKRAGGNYGSGNGSPQPYDRGSINGPGPYNGFSAQAKDETGRVIGNWPCNKPPWGRLWAVDANTGDIAWVTTLGTTEALPEGKRNTGGSGSAGPIVTAGGLLFIGATNDARFRAFDSKTGKELWSTKMPAAGNANPMTYQGKNGKQYVAIMAGNSLQVFALP